MKNKVFENHTFVTKDWLKVANSFVDILYNFILMVLVFLCGALWIISLGHIVLVKTLNTYIDKRLGFND